MAGIIKSMAVANSRCSGFAFSIADGYRQAGNYNSNKHLLAEV
jgi:hypothetical protein